MIKKQTIDVQYPKIWFEKHPDDKPILSITLVTEGLEKARKMLRKGITDNNTDLDLAKTFLYYYAKTMTATLDD